MAHFTSKPGLSVGDIVCHPFQITKLASATTRVTKCRCFYICLRVRNISLTTKYNQKVYKSNSNPPTGVRAAETIKTSSIMRWQVWSWACVVCRVEFWVKTCDECIAQCDWLGGMKRVSPGLGWSVVTSKKVWCDHRHMTLTETVDTNWFCFVLFFWFIKLVWVVLATLKSTHAHAGTRACARAHTHTHIHTHTHSFKWPLLDADLKNFTNDYVSLCICFKLKLLT